MNEIITTVASFVLGGGLMTMITIRATRKKANAEAKGSEIENEKYMSQTLMEYIVEPLKKELNALRKDVRKLQKAIDKISECPHSDNCPVRYQLRSDQEADESKS